MLPGASAHLLLGGAWLVSPPARGEAADKEHQVTRRSLQGSKGNQTALPTPSIQRLRQRRPGSWPSGPGFSLNVSRPRCCLSGTRAPSVPAAPLRWLPLCVYL